MALATSLSRSSPSGTGVGLRIQEMPPLGSLTGEGEARRRRWPGRRRPGLHGWGGRTLRGGDPGLGRFGRGGWRRRSRWGARGASGQQEEEGEQAGGAGPGSERQGRHGRGGGGGGGEPDAGREPTAGGIHRSASYTGPMPQGSLTRDALRHGPEPAQRLTDPEACPAPLPPGASVTAARPRAFPGALVAGLVVLATACQDAARMDGGRCARRWRGR
jgi:hypothetical protein